MDITFVTGNKAKIIETQKILEIPLKIKNLDLDEIQETDVEKVTRHKVEKAYQKIGSPVLVDDVGLYIDAWNGFPGPLVKWILKKGKGDASLLLKMLQNEKKRKATARLGIGFHDGKKSHVFIGETRGFISEEIRGKNGFGWDPVFIPDGSDKTYAEMTQEEKLKISHRRRGLDLLKKYLNNV